ncbi:MAG: hypothetical protein AAF597_13010, partial [Bacteroidota bacterium]
AENTVPPVGTALTSKPTNTNTSVAKSDGTTDAQQMPNAPASTTPLDGSDQAEVSIANTIPSVSRINRQRAGATISLLPGPRAISEITFSEALPVASVTRKFKTARAQRLSAGVHVGGNLLFRNYASAGDDTGEQLNGATGQMIGQTAAIDFQYRLTPKLSLSIGIDYYRGGNTFQYVSERDTMIPHPTPPNTGLIEAIARRTVAHNNQEERISIPLLLAYEHRFGNFTAGIGGGVGLNWQTSASGRTINSNGRIVAYDAPLQRSFFPSWQVQPRLSWRPKPELPWEVQLRLDAARFRLQPSAITGTQARGWLLGAAVGVRYRFEQ